MDIEFLLVLQNFRFGINDALTPFMEWASHFVMAYLLVVPVFIYWCLDKKKGLFILISLECCQAFNSVIKLTVCEYRPWIKDSRIIPAEGALKEATGYAFPSGHTVAATNMYGGIAASYRKKKLLAIVCVVMILITAFSRNYLGVHYLHDVVVAMALSILFLYLTAKLFSYLELHPEKEDILLLCGVIFSVAVLVYFRLKSYPMDYDADGNLLVDPNVMLYEGYKVIGLFMPLCICRYIERHFIGFRCPGFTVKGVIVSLIGLVPMYVINKYLEKILAPLCGSNLGAFFAMTVLVIHIAVI
ncbi:MAG: phosphatase PAP2 family protein, partial [Firmicutes bacterium]|nr:phosphatase PAP2 family protein [Bacillota bacterium]